MTTQSEPRTRLFVADDLYGDAAVTLDRDQAHYLRSVLRFTKGDVLRLFNGRDGEWIGRLNSLSKSQAAVTATKRLRMQSPEPDIWLVFAALKKTPMDFIAEKATELGASKLLPIQTDRANASRVNHDRLSATIRDAAQQCERLSIPTLVPAKSLKDTLQNWPTNRRLLAMDETGEGPPITEVLAESPPQPKDGILIGPEGGFSADELKFLDSQTCVTRTTLGRRILRAETAALAALALWQGYCGDGDAAPRS